MMIAELRSLIWLGFLKNTAVEIGVILEIVGMSPPANNRNYKFYVIGGATSLLFIIVFSDWVYRRRKKFVPLAFWLMMNVLY
jgi:hypothetical protein